jgi:hypothetical protein
MTQTGASRRTKGPIHRDEAAAKMSYAILSLGRTVKPTMQDPNASLRSPQTDMLAIKIVLGVFFLWELKC